MYAVVVPLVLAAIARGVAGQASRTSALWACCAFLRCCRALELPCMIAPLTKRNECLRDLENKAPCRGEP